VKVLARLRDRYPAVRLLIAGEGGFRDELEKLVAAMSLQESVALVGNRRDVAALLHASDLFVFASWRETLGLAVLEAMAAERPVVGIEIPALRETVINDQTGILVERRDPDLFSAAISRLLESPNLCRSMGRAGARRVREEFDVRKATRTLEELYHDLVGHKPPS